MSGSSEALVATPVAGAPVHDRKNALELRAKMKALGAIWRPQHELWELPWGVVRELGIEDRVVATQREVSRFMILALGTYRHKQASIIASMLIPVGNFPGAEQVFIQ
jgi:hypothetical protein